MPTIGAMTLQPAGLGVDPDLDADAAELALDLLAELLPFARVDERRVLVEVLEHPLEGALEQLAARDRPDVVGLDLLDGVDEEAVELEHLVLRLGPLRGLPAEQADRPDHGQSQTSSVSASCELSLGVDSGHSAAVAVLSARPGTAIRISYA